MTYKVSSVTFSLYSLNHLAQFVSAQYCVDRFLVLFCHGGKSSEVTFGDMCVLSQQLRM